MLIKTKQLVNDQEKIRKWLISIGENDENAIQETMDLMRTNTEYRIFILDYAKELIK